MKNILLYFYSKFCRSNLISNEKINFRGISLAPFRSLRKNGKEKKARRQENKKIRKQEKMCEDFACEGKIRRCEWEKMWRWKMWRCEDVKMWRCEDVKMWRCEDEKMWRCEDVRMWRWKKCEDVKMWGCEDEKIWRWEDEKIWRWKNAKIWKLEN